MLKEYLSQGYSVYKDKFNTSCVLVTDLYGLGVHVTGTLDCNRVEVPTEISNLKKKLAHKSMSQGDGVYVCDGTLVYVVWNDTKCVSVMSNEHPSHSEGTVLRNVKNNAGVNEKKDVPIPAIVYSYNCLMNDVDLFDELIKYYNILHQTHKCWKTFLHFVEIAIVNSYIIYKEVHP